MAVARRLRPAFVSRPVSAKLGRRPALRGLPPRLDAGQRHAFMSLQSGRGTTGLPRNALI